MNSTNLKSNRVRHLRFRHLAIAAAALILPDLASATLLFHGAIVPTAESNHINFDPVVVSSDSPVYEVVNAEDPSIGSLSGVADSCYGHVAVDAFATAFSDQANLQARAVFQDDQLLFHADDPNAYPNGTVPVSLNLIVSGQTNYNHDRIGQINVALYVSINGVLVGGMSRAVYDIPGLDQYDTCGGNLPGDCHDASYATVTQQITVPLDTPVSVTLDLNVASGVAANGGVPTVDGDYRPGVNFPVGSDLFNLPPGVTVNEPEAFIFDNRFVPPPDCAPGPVCVGDVDGDGFVNVTDLGIMLSNYGTGTLPEQGDLNGDGAVNLSDLGLLLVSYGVPCP